MCVCKKKRKGKGFADDHVYPSPTVRNMKLSIQSRAARTICPSPSIQTHHHNL